MSVITVTATTESNAQQIGGWWEYMSGSSEWWDGVRLVGWISQSKTNRTTVLYLKWQRYRFNYYPFDNNTHRYSVAYGGNSWDAIFALPQSISNSTIDLTGAGTLTFQHGTDGTGGGQLEISGYKCFATFTDNTITVKFPDLPAVSPDPQPEPDPDPDPEETPPAPIVVNNDPRYFIYADGDLVYAAGVEGYEVLDPKVIIEVNKAGSMTFDIPVGSEMYNRFNLLKTTVEARQGNEVIFRGRVLNRKRNVRNTIAYYNEGFLSWLKDIVFQPTAPYSGQARSLLKEFLRRYNLRAASNRKITYEYSDISTKVKYGQKDHSTAWDEIKKVLIDGVGGYIVPYLTPSETGIQWLSTYGRTTSQVIEFGENLLDFSEYIDASNVFTAVRAYGKEIDGTRVSLTGNYGFVQDDDAISIFGRIERTVIFDEIEDENTLRAAALQYLRTGLAASMTISIKAVDLHLLNVDVERIRVGDSVRVVSWPHSIDAYFLCTKIVYDFGHPKNTLYTFGSTQRTISELTDSSYSKYVITEGDL